MRLTSPMKTQKIILSQQNQKKEGVSASTHILFPWYMKVLCRLLKEKYRHQPSYKIFDRLSVLHLKYAGTTVGQNL